MNHQPTFQQQDAATWLTVAPGVQRMIMGYNDQLMMVQVKFETGAIGDPHFHPHLQSSFVAEGSFEVTIGGVTRLLSKGDSFFVESNIVHGVVCKQAGLLVDVFNPCRQDFL